MHKILTMFVFSVTLVNFKPLLSMEKNVPKKILREIKREQAIKKVSNLWSTFVERSDLQCNQDTPDNFFFINEHKIVINDTILNLKTNSLSPYKDSKPFFIRYYYDHNNESINKIESHKALVHFRGWLLIPPMDLKKRIRKNRFIERIPTHLIIHECYFSEHGSPCLALFQERNNRTRNVAICSLQPFTIVALLKTMEEYETIENISINPSGTIVMAYVRNTLLPQARYQLIQYLPKNLTQPLSVANRRIENFSNINFAFE